MIRRAALALLATLAALPGQAQVEWRTLGQAQQEERPASPEMSSGTEAVLRGLDKISGQASDLSLPVGGTLDYGTLRITLTGCRYPSENPASEAYAFLTITDLRGEERVFQGWMVASSPALNALDHPRFDVWVMSCH